MVGVPVSPCGSIARMPRSSAAPPTVSPSGPDLRTQYPVVYHVAPADRLTRIRREGLRPGADLAARGVTLHWGGLTQAQPWVHVATSALGALSYIDLNGWAEQDAVLLAVTPTGRLLDPSQTPGVVDPGNVGEDLLHEGPVPARYLAEIPRADWRALLRADDALRRVEARVRLAAEAALRDARIGRGAAKQAQTPRLPVSRRRSP